MLLAGNQLIIIGIDFEHLTRWYLRYDLVSNDDKERCRGLAGKCTIDKIISEEVYTSQLHEKSCKSFENVGQSRNDEFMQMK